MTTRRGTTVLGCLFSLMIVAAILYFGIPIGETYWRLYEFQDAMKQDVRFASSNSNDKILTHLRAKADSLDLPEDAHAVAIRRTPKDISIEAEYYVNIVLPMYKREVLLHPHAEGSL